VFEYQQDAACFVCPLGLGSLGFRRADEWKKKDGVSRWKVDSAILVVGLDHFRAGFDSDFYTLVAEAGIEVQQENGKRRRIWSKTSEICAWI
jgi:hypothetical protein